MSDIIKNSLKRKILFCIVGTENTGKTSIIKKIYDLYKNNASFKSTCLNYLGNKNSDFSDVFNLNINNINITIGILSAGDEKITIDKELQKFINCDYIICVSRTKGNTKEVIETFANTNEFVLRQINKSYFWKTYITQKYKSITANEEHYLNDFFSKLLYSLINEYIKGII